MTEMTPVPVVVETQAVDKQADQSVLIPRCAFRGFLTNASAVLHTANALANHPAGSTWFGGYLRSITLCNTDSAARTVTLYAYESGGSAGANRAIVNALSLDPGQTVVLRFPGDTFPLDAGENIAGLASVTNVVSCQVRVADATG
jgi:hypothetical protein